MRWIERAVNLRSRYQHMPYGDQALYVRRKIFQALGGFPDVPIAEDLLFVRRLTRRGRIAIAPVAAVTSGRRWQRLGPLRTTLVNQAILLGIRLGIPLEKLARLY